MPNKVLFTVPQKVVDLIIKNYGINEVDAVDRLYSSKVYSLLEDVDTGFWHFDPLLLFQLFNEEQITGKITVPEVVL